MSAKKQKQFSSTFDSAVDEATLELRDPRDWEAILIESLRYRAELLSTFVESGAEMQARLASYTMLRPMAGDEHPRVRLGVYWDSGDDGHDSFMRSTWLNASQKVKFLLRLPKQVIAFEGEWVELTRNKIVFEIKSNLYQLKNRRTARVPLRFTVAHPASSLEVDNESVWQSAEAFDLSEDGIGLVMKESAFRTFPSISSRIEGLTFRVGGRSFRVDGNVKHASRVEQNQYPQKRFRVGIEFEGLTHDERIALRELLLRAQHSAD